MENLMEEPAAVCTICNEECDGGGCMGCDCILCYEHACPNGCFPPEPSPSDLLNQLVADVASDFDLRQAIKNPNFVLAISSESDGVVYVSGVDVERLAGLGEEDKPLLRALQVKVGLQATAGQKAKSARRKVYNTEKAQVMKSGEWTVFRLPFHYSSDGYRLPSPCPYLAEIFTKAAA